ncbi:MAG: hypothetical protein H7281_05480 [Bacteriovorax sp.]|nr:hypothetical protein [Bacteriovorax sp.]
MKFVIVAFLNILTSMNVFAAKDTFSKSEIVYPLGKQEIVKFLNLLKDPINQKVTNLQNAPVTFQEIPQEGSAVFSIGPESYLLYLNDLNNDGNKEYLLTYLHSGSGDYSGIEGAYTINNGKVTSLNLDKIIVKNLFPNGDMSRFHSYLAKPFVVRVDRKIYLRFQDQPSAKNIFTYFWHESEFKKIDL